MVVGCCVNSRGSCFCAHSELLLFRKMAESTPLRKSSTPRAKIRAILVEHVNRELNAALSGERDLSRSVGWTIKAITTMDREAVLRFRKEEKEALLMLEEAALMEDEALKIKQEVKKELEIIARMRDEMEAYDEEDENYRCDDESCLMCMFDDD